MTKNEMPDEVLLQINKGCGSLEEVVSGGTRYTRADAAPQSVDVEEIKREAQAWYERRLLLKESSPITGCIDDLAQHYDFVKKEKNDETESK